jgi:hypothetical protein
MPRVVGQLSHKSRISGRKFQKQQWKTCQMLFREGVIICPASACHIPGRDPWWGLRYGCTEKAVKSISNTGAYPIAYSIGFYPLQFTVWCQSSHIPLSSQASLTQLGTCLSRCFSDLFLVLQHQIPIEWRETRC